MTPLSTLPLSCPCRLPLLVLMMSSTSLSLIQKTLLTLLPTRRGSGISATSAAGTVFRWVLSDAVVQRTRRASISVSPDWRRPTTVYPMVQRVATFSGKAHLVRHCGRRMMRRLRLSIPQAPLPCPPSSSPCVMGCTSRLPTNIPTHCKNRSQANLDPASPVSKSTRKEKVVPYPSVVHLPLYPCPVVFITHFLLSHP